MGHLELQALIGSLPKSTQLVGRPTTLVAVFSLKSRGPFGDYSVLLACVAKPYGPSVGSIQFENTGSAYVILRHHMGMDRVLECSLYATSQEASTGQQFYDENLIATASISLRNLVGQLIPLQGASGSESAPFQMTISFPAQGKVKKRANAPIQWSIRGVVRDDGWTLSDPKVQAALRGGH